MGKCSGQGEDPPSDIDLVSINVLGVPFMSVVFHREGAVGLELDLGLDLDADLVLSQELLFAEEPILLT